MANRFYANRMAIKAISEKEGVDVMDEWNDIQRSYMKSKTKTLADLFK